MTQRSVAHATFTVERRYDAAPARVFACFADPQEKARWFAAPGAAGRGDYRLDFRVGGREHSRGGPPGGPVYTFDALYQDIVPNERIITTYEMQMDGRRISVSVATVVLEAAGKGTRVVVTEQGAFLDGLDKPESREHGTGALLDALGRALQQG